uniref:C-terminal processing peptidase n=1 Tax=Dunaliella tertiolecta TaxID=3047 RepID=A0A6S8GX33_DUNTE
MGAGMLATALAFNLTFAQPAESISTEQLLFLDTWRAVDRAYVDKTFNGQSWFKLREQFLKKEPMNSREETYAAIRKLLATLDDPFTRFLEPSRLDALRKGTRGAVVGVGVEVTYDESQGQNGELVVLTPVPGGPADKAGIRAGDFIVSVNGKSTKGLSLYEASDLLTGPEGSQAELQVRSSDSPEIKTYNISRLRVTLNPVTYAACSAVSPSVGGISNGSNSQGDNDGKLGYMRVTTFSSKTVGAFQDALQDLRSKGAGERLVLDLRNNGGGLFPAGVELGRLLLNQEDIVFIADSQGVRDIFSAEGRAMEARAPLAVLVNKGTASASEVLAGALKDAGRASIVASENSFGKGLIQTIVNLPDGSGLAITVAKYQTPSGTDINKVGIAPTIKLQPEQMPPIGPDAFCSAVQDPSAPRLFK